jgi:hypothetical protein
VVSQQDIEKTVITKDKKELGKIKSVSEYYLQLEAGKIKKHNFWIPKYIFETDSPNLLITKEDVLAKYYYSEEPSKEQYSYELDQFQTEVSKNKEDKSIHYLLHLRLND